MMFSCLVSERELGWIGIWFSRKCYCVLLYLPIFIVKFLRRYHGGNQFVEPRKFLYLLFNFCLFTVIDLSPKVLYAQEV